MERIKIAWHDSNETISIMETEEQAYNFKINMRDFDTEQADFTAFFDDKDSLDNILDNAVATHSAQLHKTYLADETTGGTPDSLTIQVVKGHNVVAGDYLTAGSEVLLVNSINTVPIAYDEFDVSRFQGASKGNVLYQGLTIYNATPRLGLECYLYDVTGTYPIRWLYVKEISSVGAGYEILFSDVINKWDKDVAIPKEIAEQYENYQDLSYLVFDRLGRFMSFIASIVDFDTVKYPNYNLAATSLFSIEDDEEENLSFNLADILNVIKKMTNSYLVFNKDKATTIQSLGSKQYALLYSFVTIEPLGVETTTTALEVDPKILMERGYTFQKLNAGYNLKMTYRYKVDEDNYATGTIFRTGFGGDTGTTIDIDMSDYTLWGIESRQDLLRVADDILASYKPMYARSVGVLTVDIPFEDEDIEVGKFYTFEDIALFDVLLDTEYTVYLYCVTRDNDEVTFLVLQTEKTAYVGVAFPCFRIDDNSVYVPFSYVRDWFDLPTPPFRGWEDGDFHYRKISNTIEWVSTVGWDIMDLASMTILDSLFSIDSVALDSNGNLVITSASRFTGMGTSPLLLKARWNNTNGYFIDKGKGV